MQIANKIPPFVERNLGNALIVALLTIIYAPILVHWVDGWLNKNINIEHEYFSCALIGFPYAAYLFFIKHREAWGKLENISHPLGAILLTIGAAFYLSGTTLWVDLSLPIVLIGICLWLKGIPGLKLQWFPLLLVALATPNPIPYLLTPYTLPLQEFIAGVGGFILMQLGMKAEVNGIYLEMNGRSVEVAPYCAGLKMLFTSLYVSLILLSWTEKLDNRKRTILLLISAVGLSIFANIIRNTLLAWFHGMGQEQNFHILHDGWGGDLYSMTLLILIVGANSLFDRWETNWTGETSEEEENIHE